MVAKIQAICLKVIIEERRQLSETITLSNVLLLNQRDIKKFAFSGGVQRSETEARLRLQERAVLRQKNMTPAATVYLSK